jgi:hypothetical protein
MHFRLPILMLCLAATVVTAATATTAAGAPGPGEIPFDQPPHDYWKRPLTDRFSQLKTQIESGRLSLEAEGEKAFLLRLLRALDIPASSQMLVFSTTSLQLRLISPANPRALFFNEDVYVGYIPGGRIEVVSIDPDLGGIYYIFDIPRGGQPLQPERSNRCMNCHASEDTGFVPGLVVKSVMPGPHGGSLDAYRQGLTGDGVPFKDRFGGWYVTGYRGAAEHLGNFTGRLSPEGLTKIPIVPGQLFDFARYPMSTSDILPQLVHEHQTGFVNRVVAATYRAREILEKDKGVPDAAGGAELDRQARDLTRYLLFADETPLPAGGIEGDPAFKADFLRSRRATLIGASLKDFDLKTRLFRNRCSYMIYSTAFRGLPPAIKQRVYRRLSQALNVSAPDAEYAFLPAAEKQTIHSILRSTVPDLPSGW